jgi:hypothetical protein
MSPRAPLSAWYCRAAALSLVVALAACGGGSKHQAVKHATTSQKLQVPGAHVELRLASINVQSAGPAVNLDEKTKVTVMTQTRQYVEDAIVKPLLSGKKQKGLASLFGPTISAAALGADRAALTDEAVGKVKGDVNAPASQVAMTALVGGDGSVPFIATDFNLNLTSKLGSQPLTIKRHTELTFQKTPSGHWIVTAYRVFAARTVGSKTTTTTTGKKP